MFFRKICFLWLSLFLSVSMMPGELKIKSFQPATPYIGLPFYIHGSGFQTPDKVSLAINDVSADPDYIIEWGDSQIGMILPDISYNNTLNITNGLQDDSKIFYTKRLVNVDHFNAVRYNLQFYVTLDNIVNYGRGGGKVYLYIPQPIISDELIYKRIISITPQYDYEQDNGVLIFEIDPAKQRRFRMEENLEITTVYKKVYLDNTVDQNSYDTTTPFYKYYTSQIQPFIIPNHSSIIALVNRIIKNETNTVNKIRLIYNWVTWRMNHKYPPDDRSPLYTMVYGTGDCLSDAYLFTTLIRAAGIPIRINSGMIFYHGWMVGGLHSWEDVFVPGVGWIPIDISYGHSPYFLKVQKYPTQSDFYFGGSDGRRMAFSRGKVNLMKPQEDGTLAYSTTVDMLQVPYIDVSNPQMRINYKINYWLDIKDYKVQYDEATDWFLSHK